MDKITLNGITYVPETEINELAKAEEFEGMKYCIIRTYSAGVFAGYVEIRNGKEATLRKVRRIWYWSGANSLSQLAKDGTQDAKSCKLRLKLIKLKLRKQSKLLNAQKKQKNL